MFVVSLYHPGRRMHHPEILFFRGKTTARLRAEVFINEVGEEFPNDPWHFDHDANILDAWSAEGGEVTIEEPVFEDDVDVQS